MCDTEDSIATTTLDITRTAGGTGHGTAPTLQVVHSDRYQTTPVVDLNAARSADQPTVGTKAASLGELLTLGVAVPPGFVLTTALYRHFQKMNGLDRLIAQRLRGLTIQRSSEIHRVSLELQAAVRAGRLDQPTEQLITARYADLRLNERGGLALAVRPSIPPTDRADHQSMGHHTTLLGVTGNQELLEAIKAVWASLLSPVAIAEYVAHGTKADQLLMAVVVQTLVASEVAGVLTTIDSASGARDMMVIEAAWGLGQVVVRGLLTPDRYTIVKATGEVVERVIGTQAWQLGRTRPGGRVQHLPVPAELTSVPKLHDEKLRELVTLGQTIERHFQFPQNIEWAFVKQKLLCLDTQPLPRVHKRLTVSSPGVNQAVTLPTPLLRGASAALGMAAGPVRIIHRTEDLDRITAGDILVAELTTPDFLPLMNRVAAMVTDAGGRTSHAALLSHEFGIPMVVGTGTATHLLHEGQIVTVDGTAGVVYRGKIDVSRITALHSVSTGQLSRESRLRRSVGQSAKTATKILINLANPEQATEMAKLGADGVGLIRAEFMIARMGEHPKAMLDDGRGDQFTNTLADGIEQIARAFHPHPVVYRTTDFKSNEYRALRGGDRYEPPEENPMLGLRGAARYLADPTVLTAELAALKEVRGHRGWENVQLMLPFVRTVPELRAAKEYIAAAGLTADRTFKLRMMVEVPSNVFLIDQFLAEGVDGISIGSNDLTQLILGVDRESAVLRPKFNELDPAVVTAIRTVIRACRAHHVPVSVCGQAASDYPQFAEFLIHEGVTSLSVDPGSVDSVRQLVASVEHHLPSIH